jgi:LppX_LprAFG lipoprotein
MQIDLRRASWGVCGLIAVLALLLAACGTSTPPPSASTLLTKASTAFNNDSSLHLTYTATNIAPGITAVTSASGDLVRPDKISITGVVEPVKNLSASIGLIIIGQDQFLNISGSWSKTSAFGSLLHIFDADQGIGGIITKLQNPSKVTTENVKIDSSHTVACWKVSGTTTAGLLAPITQGSPTDTTPLQATLWIGQTDGQVYKVDLVGKAITGDSANTDRTFILSKFGEQVTITAPAVS